MAKSAKSSLDAALEEVERCAKADSKSKEREREANNNPQFELAVYVKNAVNYIWNNCHYHSHLDEDEFKTYLSNFSYEQKVKIMFEYKTMWNRSETKREFYLRFVNLLTDGLFLLKEED